MTGFLGTPYLCYALSQNGYLDVAYELLLREEYPSWLFPVKQGATTIWERWDGIKPDGSFQTPSMNSFNHYAYGAIGEWMVRFIAGLDVDPAYPGFKRAIVAPKLGGGFTSARASFESINGVYAVDWKLADGVMQMAVTAPANGGAVVQLPGAILAQVTEGGRPLAAIPEIQDAHQTEDGVHLTVGSGYYTFAYPRN
ncbi:MAG: hypothetical protein IPK16_33195 [Anaerolineales bacterium]|nr:hypothetical protein [Anaerolineales bacterium]